MRRMCRASSCWVEVRPRDWGAPALRRRSVAFFPSAVAGQLTRLAEVVLQLGVAVSWSRLAGAEQVCAVVAAQSLTPLLAKLAASVFRKQQDACWQMPSCRFEPSSSCQGFWVRQRGIFELLI